MAHELENNHMVYVGEVPWHGLGVRIPSDLSPEEVLVKANLDWEVEKIPAFINQNGEEVPIDRSALVRSSDGKILDVVTDDWQPVQNRDAFSFFNEFIAAGDMEMHTAGSLKGGQIVWGLANIKESFELFNGDIVSGYLLFSNFHKYGFSTDVRFTPIRVVCNNTMTLALNTKSQNAVKYSHRKVFQPDIVKEMLGVAKEKLAEYKEVASFLGSKKAKNEDIVEYFKRVFPILGTNTKKKELSRNATAALSALHSQPGWNFAEGSWWQPFNAVTYMVDHKLGRSADTRLSSSWYGINKSLKDEALSTALEYANAA
jgi:phage/plasmid-like protein (TIGR03299 family)